MRGEVTGTEAGVRGEEDGLLLVRGQPGPGQGERDTVSHSTPQQPRTDLAEADLAQTEMEEAAEAVDEGQQVGDGPCPCPAVRQVEGLQAREPGPSEECHGTAWADQVLVDGDPGPEKGRTANIVEVSGDDLVSEYLLY